MTLSIQRQEHRRELVLFELSDWVVDTDSLQEEMEKKVETALTQWQEWFYKQQAEAQKAEEGGDQREADYIREQTHRPGSTNIIFYGIGGKRRYFVRANGTLAVSRSHSMTPVLRAEAITRGLELS